MASVTPRPSHSSQWQDLEQLPWEFELNSLSANQGWAFSPVSKWGGGQQSEVDPLNASLRTNNKRKWEGLHVELPRRNIGTLISVSIFWFLFKGTVARDFEPLVFFMNQPHMGPWFMTQNIFCFHFEFAEIFEFESGSARYHTPQNKKQFSR